MTSIYQKAMGADFEKLHPKIQERFGFESSDGIAAIGTGTMQKIWHGPLYTLPFLYVGTWRRIMFPEQGAGIPFTIQNFAYVDKFGRETVTWVRTFKGRIERRFDATMIYSAGRKRIIDYLGTHQHLAVDIELSVDPKTKGMRLQTAGQRFYEGPIGFQFPMFFSGVAEVCEWYDDEINRFRISVNVSNSRWGPLFGYDGIFDVEWKKVRSSQIPQDVKPIREENRD